VYFFLFFPVGTETRGGRFPTGTILLLVLLFIHQIIATVDPRLFAQLLSSAYLPSHPTWSGAFLGLFLHGDWFHLGGNALYLWVFGRQIESRMGLLPLFLLFIAGGMAASWIQGICTPDDSWARNLRIIGASGSVAALLGMTVVRFPHRRVRIAYFLFTIIGGYARASTAYLHAFIACGLWFVFQVAHGLVALGNGGGNVAYFAHAGGFLFGALVSFAFGLHRRVREEIHRDRGSRYAERCQWHAAAGEYTQHLQLVPDDFEVARARAQALDLAGSSTESMREYRRLLGDIRKKKNVGLAADLYLEMRKRGIEADLNASGLLKMAFEFQRGRFDEAAVVAYEELGARFPEHPGADLARLRAAEILWEKLGRLEDARAEYEKLLETYPDSEWCEIAEARVSSMRALTGGVSASPSSRGSATARSLGAVPRTSASSSRPSPILPKEE
jgi:membrane associated rhomboid family serine protease